MILSCDAAFEPSTSAVNLSIEARTASLPSSSGSKRSAGCGPYCGGMTSSQPAPRQILMACPPTSSRVRAVISTFQDMPQSLTIAGRGASATLFSESDDQDQWLNKNSLLLRMAQ